MKGDDKGSYVHRVREDTQRYIKELLGENEKLRSAIAVLEDEKRSLEARFEVQAKMLSQEIERRESEKVRLQEQLSEIESENKRFLDQYSKVEQHNTNLANLYVASYQLHSTMNRKEVLDVIQEIVINLIGSEEFGVFELRRDHSAFDLIASFGLDEEKYRTVSAKRSLIGRTALSGNTWVAGRDAADEGLDDRNLVACIPLNLGQEVTGAIAMFSLLAHKSELEDVDFELFDLLATHAGTALYCTELHTEREGALQ
jgi:hypothetical protein